MRYPRVYVMQSIVLKCWNAVNFRIVGLVAVLTNIANLSLGSPRLVSGRRVEGDRVPLDDDGVPAAGDARSAVMVGRVVGDDVVGDDG